MLKSRNTRASDLAFFHIDRELNFPADSRIKNYVRSVERRASRQIEERRRVMVPNVPETEASEAEAKRNELASN